METGITNRRFPLGLQLIPWRIQMHFDVAGGGNNEGLCGGPVRFEYWYTMRRQPLVAKALQKPFGPRKDTPRRGLREGSSEAGGGVLGFVNAGREWMGSGLEYVAV